MTLLKKTALATVLMVGSFASQAATYDIAANNPNGNYYDVITVTDSVGGFFTDTFNFSTDAFAPLSAFAFSYVSDVALFLDFNIDGIPGLPMPMPGASIAAFQLPLPAGSHTLSVTGLADNGAQYQLSLSPISAVSEPTTIGLMFGGLGLVGLLAARRKQA